MRLEAVYLRSLCASTLKTMPNSLVMKRTYLSLLCLAALLFSLHACKSAEKAARKGQNLDIIAYYSGNGRDLQQYHWEQLSQVIFCFCHLQGNLLKVDNAGDSLVIRQLVALKTQYPKLKVLLSLGGWGGCLGCSDAFSSVSGRHEFALSVKSLLDTYGADGIDLDWEYPAIEGYPGHPYKPEDKDNFTKLVQELRQILGENAEISFAAGGFDSFFTQSVAWSSVMPLVNRVNLMSYDLVNGYSKVTGHHTPLRSNEKKSASVEQGVRSLRSLGVPASKIVVGAAFYARTWVGVENINNGLYQAGQFKSFVPFNEFDAYFKPENGFVFYRDPVSQAPYAYSPTRQEFATFDDATAVEAKTKYAQKNGLGGIMFWQLGSDKADKGLLQAIFTARNAP
jgi:chitinase